MPPTSLDPTKIDFQKYYFYGTILNIPPILAMYPMRTVRLLQQRKSSIPVSSSIFAVIKDVKRNNGVRALYAGATVFSIGLTSTKILQFASYDYLAQKIKENDHFGIEAIKNPSVLGGVLGTSSAVITTFFVVPFDMVSQQITLAKAGVQGKLVPSTVTNSATSVAPPIVPATGTAAASNIPIHVSGSRASLQPAQPMPISESLKLQLKQEGVRFLFRGYVATLMSAVPFFAAYFPAYEISKVWVKDGIQYVRSIQTKSENPFPPPESHQLIISSIAGSMASLAGVFVSSPSDMVKTRIQTEQRLQPTNGTGVKLPMPSLKWMDVFMEIWKKEGFLKFFAGTKARAILAVPGGALNFVIFDFVRSISTIKEPSMSMNQLPIPAEVMDGLV
ncbi:mitochondrial aspartate-glutamate transporter agc1 [Entomortierella chlamydospora]|uniref:Mitochondrial aspartate-glutamate transporter agc1 n=1 Tax=Entomortierella chlamydospora TaxID=101097 RepID=A0A9P6MTQ1_9FUNG|nr:mitochondrial aspartate-glutamate transporter agc1 [Entomortierella chlamydospora]KAG0012744.1 mitochondrial aspartate-glutamate transporter agc1 [Entomortierella chlamydospora]